MLLKNKGGNTTFGACIFAIMKKFLPYLIVTVVLGATLGYFMYSFSPSTLEKNESNFAFKDIDEITQIQLSDNKGTKILLSKNESGQWLADKQYEVGEMPLGLLFEALQKVQTQGPVSEKGTPNVIRDLLHTHHKIEIYTNGKKPAKAYYIGGPTLNGLGTYMLMEIDGEPAKKPYITYIPNVRAYLTGRYNAALLHWRSIWVYNTNSEHIKALSVTYHNVDSLQSFSLEKNADNEFVFFNHLKERAPEQPKAVRISQYLDFYQGLSIEGFKNDFSGKDSILSKGAFCTISLTDLNGKTKTAALYRAPITEASMVRVDQNGRPLNFDLERFYVLYNDQKDFGIAQYGVWAKALRAYDEFLTKGAKTIKNE